MCGCMAPKDLGLSTVWTLCTQKLCGHKPPKIENLDITFVPIELGPVSPLSRNLQVWYQIDRR